MSESHDSVGTTQPAAPQPRRSVLRKLLNAYKFVAIVTFNTALLFVLLNLALYVGFSIYDKDPYVPLYGEYGEDRIAQAYPDFDKQERDEILRSIWVQDFEFQPYVQYREKPLKSKWLNVTEHGYRKGLNQHAWPPPADAPSIFVFGGSTTFGYGVGDEHTVSSHLQAYLEEKLGRKVSVYNFGRAGYYSTQERILLEQLMLAGHSPRLAVFIDGINEVGHADDRPDHTDALSVWMSYDRRSGAARQQVLADLPVTRAVHAVREKLVGKPKKEEADPDVDYAGILRPMMKATLARYFHNARLIEAVCAVDGIRPVFVWQPAPSYGYDLKHHLFGTEAMYRTEGSYYAYRELARRLKGKPGDLPAQFVWLGDLQRRFREPLYVDAWHYTPRFCKEVGHAIGEELLQRKLLGEAAR